MGSLLLSKRTDQEKILYKSLCTVKIQDYIYLLTTLQMYHKCQYILKYYNCCFIDFRLHGVHSDYYNFHLHKFLVLITSGIVGKQIKLMYKCEKIENKKPKLLNDVTKSLCAVII